MVVPFSYYQKPQLHLSPSKLSLPSTLVGAMGFPSLHKPLKTSHPPSGFTCQIRTRTSSRMRTHVLFCTVHLQSPLQGLQTSLQGLQYSTIQCISSSRACIFHKREHSTSMESSREKLEKRMRENSLQYTNSHLNPQGSNSNSKRGNSNLIGVTHFMKQMVQLEILFPIISKGERNYESYIFQRVQAKNSQ